MDYQEKIAEQRIVCIKQQSKIPPLTLIKCILVARVQSLKNEYERTEIHLETHEKKPILNWQKKYTISNVRTNHMQLDGKS